jgi:hypothetical protein
VTAAGGVLALGRRELPTCTAMATNLDAAWARELPASSRRW